MKSSVMLAAFIAAWLTQGQVFAANEPNDAHAHNGQKAQPNISETEEQHKHRENSEHKEHDEHGHDEELITQISDSMAADVNIVTASADSQLLKQRVVVYGKLNVDPDSISHVNARFAGLIKSVKFSVGESVKPGDVLAEVESNESLNSYSIKAPIGGMIIQRQANTGEVSQQQVLFTIANFDTLWVDLRIYPSQQTVISTGQKAVIMASETSVSGVIQHIIPSLTEPYQHARVKLENHTGQLVPGQMVEGYIVTGEFQVGIAVKRVAIQTLDNQEGVFVKDKTKYVFTPLRLGRRDDTLVEVIAGLQPGQLYVTDNSYLLKADIEKSEAEHEH